MYTTFSSFDVLVVGAGLAGALSARLLKDAGYSVLVLEERDYPGGNCVDTRMHGCVVHRYGIHVFHTQADWIWDIVRPFGVWKDFQLRALMEYKSSFYSTPFNMFTFQSFFGVQTPEEAKRKIQETLILTEGDDAESWCLRNIGVDLYEAFVRDQLIKHWGVHPQLLPKSYIERIPLRFSYQTRYFNDKIEKVPLSYNDIFHTMLDGIYVVYNTVFNWKWYEKASAIVYTGSLDRLFDYRFGVLPYRTLDFRLSSGPSFGAHMLRCDGRKQEYRMVHWGDVTEDLGEKYEKPIVSVETARDCDHTKDIPMYPVRTKQAIAAYEKYVSILPNNIIPLGRLASFQYMDMHQVVASVAKTITNRFSVSLQMNKTVI